MKLFIFAEIEKCSSNYHEGGGLVIISENINSAKELILTDSTISVTDAEWENVEIFEMVESTTPKFWVMPNAGCC